MRSLIRILVAGAGLTAVMVGVPAVALADSSSPSNTSSTSAGTCAHPVVAYLSAHSDVATELKTLKAMPTAERAAARRSWAQAHQDEASGLRQAQQEARADRLAGLGAATSYVTAHPDVAALLTQLEQAPAGSRAATVRQYVKAHPGARAEARDLRTAVRDAACGTGSH
jgi:hemophore-related protein